MTTETARPAPTAGTDADVPHLSVAIVGNGFSGLGTAIRLRRAGVEDFLVFERHGDVGGTWRDNSYPGCACDVPSHLYSFSFAPNPDWSHSFSAQSEIHAYLQRVSAEYGIDRFTRNHHEVTEARWSEDDQRWTVTTTNGTWTADAVVLGSGALSDPSFPDVPGLDAFDGEVFHSATWRHDLDLTRPARRGDRDRRLGDPVRAGDRAGRRAPQRLPAHAPVDHAAPRPRLLRRGEVGVPPLPGPAAGAARGDLLGPRDVRVRVQGPRAHGEGREARRAPHAHPGHRPGAAREDHARLLDGLQAHPALEHLPAGAGPRERRRGHRPHHRGPPARRGHRGRHRARGRHDHRRHRLRDQRPADQPPGVRPRRTQPRRALGRHDVRPQRHHDRGLPEPVHAPRAQHRARPQLGRVHDRVADQPRHGRAAAAADVGGGRRRAPPGRPGPLRRRDAAPHRGHGVGRRRVQELVPRRPRPQLGALAHVHDAVPPAPASG